MKQTLLAFAFGGLVSLAPGFAQSVISAKAGVIHYVEGDVTVNDQKLVMQVSKFPELKNREVLRTDEGRVELLLAPGSFFRLSAQSAVRMDSNSILATKLTLLDGTALIEVAEMPKDGSLEVMIGADTVSVRKAGLYRLEMTPPSVKVYSGELAVNSNDELRKLSDGKMMTLTGDHLIARFDKKQNTDELVQWADRRSSTLAMANVHSARALQGSGFSSNGFNGFGGLGGGMGGWYFDPYFGMMTYVPYGRSAFSPFGYSYFSPRTVFAVYNPPVYSNSGGGGGYNSGGRGNTSFNSDLGYNTSSQRSPSGYVGSVGSGASAAAPVAGGQRASGVAAAGGAGRSSGGGGGRTP